MGKESGPPSGDHLEEDPLSPSEAQARADELMANYSHPEATTEVKRGAAERLLALLNGPNPPVLRPARVAGGLHDCFELLGCLCEEKEDRTKPGERNDISDVHLSFDDEDLSHPPKDKMGPDVQEHRSYFSERDAASLYKVLKFHADKVTVHLPTEAVCQKVNEGLVDADHASHDSRDAFRHLGHPQQHFSGYLFKALLDRLFSSEKTALKGEQAYTREVMRIIQEAEFPHVFSEIQEGPVGIGLLIQDIDRFLNSRNIYSNETGREHPANANELVSRLAGSLILSDHVDISRKQVETFVTDVSHFPHSRCLLQKGRLSPLQVAMNILEIEKLCADEILRLHIVEPAFDDLKELIVSFLREERVRVEMADQDLVGMISDEFRREIIEEGYVRIGTRDEAVRRLQQFRIQLRELLSDPGGDDAQHDLHNLLGELTDRKQLYLAYPEQSLGVVRGITVLRRFMRDILDESKKNRAAIRLDDQAANTLASRFEDLAREGTMTLYCPDEQAREDVGRRLKEMKKMKVEPGDLISTYGRRAIACLHVTAPSQFLPRSSGSE